MIAVPLNSAWLGMFRSPWSAWHPWPGVVPPADWRWILV